MPWPCPVAKAGPFVPQFGRKMSVVGHLVECSQDGAVNGPVRHCMLEELPHHAKDVVDPLRARRAALTRACSGCGRGAQKDNEPAQVAGAVLRASTAGATPAQEPGQFTCVYPRCRLSSVTAKAQVEQEPVGHLNPRVAAIDDRPVGLTVRQDNPERPKLSAERLARLRTLEHADDGMTSTCLPRARQTLKRDSQQQVPDC